MIGRLLQSAATTFTHQGARPQAPLESVTEETHTRDLLFPDLSSLSSSQLSPPPSSIKKAPATPKDAANSDDHGGLDVSYTKDVRIILAQDANFRYQSPQILFDTKPPKLDEVQQGPSPQNFCITGQQKPTVCRKSVTSPQITPGRKRHTQSSSINSNVQLIPTSPLSPSVSEQRPKTASAEARAAHQLAVEGFNGDIEATRAKAAKEEKEDTDAILDCIFGSAGFRLEACTKLHIIPRKAPKAFSPECKSPSTLRPVSSNGFTKRRTPLSRSTSSGEKVFDSSGAADSDERAASADKSAIMFTRLFSIELAESASQAIHEGQPMNGGTNVHAQEPSMSEEPGTAKISTAVTTAVQKKTPMYAVAFILQFPEESDFLKIRSRSSRANLSTSYSSFNESLFVNSWQAGRNHNSETTDATIHPIFDPVLRSHVSFALAHWKLVSRSMQLLELTAKSQLREYLEAIPIAPLMRAPPVRKASGKLKSKKQPMQQSVMVSPGCLQHIDGIRNKVSATAQTVVSGMRARRVVTGQDRWGAWKEEAKWVSRWAGTRDQNFFFYNFLTAFLGGHTAWLQSLSPPCYKRQSEVRQRRCYRDSNHMEQRTVIIARDKMAARRLLFLLAAFLPASSNNLALQAPTLPQVSRSNFESSPLSSIGGVRSSRPRLPESFNQMKNNSTKSGAHARSVSFSVLENNNRSGRESPIVHDRRGSESKSIRTPSFATSNQDKGMRKASASTVLVDSDIPVPYLTNPFVTSPTQSTTSGRPGSGGSLASAALTHNLKQSESTASSMSSPASRWGSVVSGFWGSRRDSLADETTEARRLVQPSYVKRGSLSNSPGKRRPSKLAQMVTEVETLEDGLLPSRSDSSSKATSRTPLPNRSFKKPAPSEEVSSARSIPSRPKVDRMPLKFSFNEADGYLDISMSPDESWTSSLASSFTSLRMPVLTSSSSIGSDEHQSGHGSLTPDQLLPRSESTSEVAGWLRTYVPSFEVQAVKPYHTLIAEIKASMYADARLATAINIGGMNDGGWEDVCTTLIADTTTFTIERLRLQRRRKADSSTNLRGDESPGPSDSSPREERLITEPVMEMDATLTDAVERLLSRSGGSSRVHSRAPSPKPVVSQSLGTTRNTSNRTDLPAVVEGGGGGAPGLHPDHRDNRAREGTSATECERILMGALQEVVRSVIEERREKLAEGDTGNSHHREPDSALREGIRKWLTVNE